jgi:AcrR family transcriptional regulator
MVENSGRRDELLENIVDALLEDGVADLSLRPLAEKVGSSARLLIYHFGTKENLVKTALDIVHARAEVSLQALAARKRPGSLKASLLLFWDWATAEENQKYLRLMFEVDGLSMHSKRAYSEDFKDEGSAMWLRMIDRVTADLPQNARAAAGRSTLVMASLNGLLQDYFSTGDRARTLAGLNYLIRIMTGEQRGAAGRK